MFYYLIFISRLIITLSAGIFLEDMFVAVVSLVPRSVSISFSLSPFPKTHSTYRRDALAGTQTIVCYLRLSATNENENDKKNRYRAPKWCCCHYTDGRRYFFSPSLSLIQRKISECVSVCRRCCLIYYSYTRIGGITVRYYGLTARLQRVCLSKCPFFLFYFTYSFVDVLTLRFRLVIFRLFLFLFSRCQTKIHFWCAVCSCARLLFFQRMWAAPTTKCKHNFLFILF